MSDGLHNGGDAPEHSQEDGNFKDKGRDKMCPCWAFTITNQVELTEEAICEENTQNRITKAKCKSKRN